MNTLTLPIVVGRKYVRRDGKIITACEPYKKYISGVIAVKLPHEHESPDSLVFQKTGRFHHESACLTHPFDLVADYVEVPVSRFTFTLTQAVQLYHSAFLPPVVGGAAEEPIYGPSEASAVARHLELPWMLSANTAIKPGTPMFEQRQTVAAMLRAWADALDVGAKGSTQNN